MNWEPLLQVVRSKLEEEREEKSRLDSRRLFHGRGNCFPGFERVCVDSYHPAILVTLFEEYEGETDLADQLWAMAQPLGYTGLAVQRRYQPRAPIQWQCGEPVEAPVARRGELQFPLTFDRQNVGFFLDIEPGRQWLEQQVQEKAGQVENLKLLNLFAFTCAFSVVARSAGELEVLNIDLNKGVLKRGQANHQYNQLATKGIRFLARDALRDFKRYDRSGPFQLAVVDPPTRQKGAFEVEINYAKLLEKLPACLADQADLLFVLNSPAHSESEFRDMISSANPGYEVVARLPQNPDFPDKDLDAALKMLHVRFRR
ncbi:class I SAM-dependent methyltransferase [Microbulbifer hydrolyticus]|uniref:23S rRNA (Cytosine1962-C5)-methyltransferase n=1 Tax=Microbulbifer hydrolyticus TaxID=48074 RepID=A0A6P1TDS8_9GAMM|nr:class I SAM-dependent methyltransferase [Microbulbifer hydrolyticus]MBB5212018.1 23S rRNA (cytosine1962-C5)-methyltransferase [Microbulbifer hydrolyticus]QHQ39700.1 SAM-dependent methyltransferase [Microbulbifer hydrolyticus]